MPTSGQEGYSKTADHVNNVFHTLPFTGLDIGLVVLVGLVLFAIGVVLYARLYADQVV